MAVVRGRSEELGVVTAVSRAADHACSKVTVAHIRLLAGLGVEGDAHLGRTVQHRSRVARDATQPNLRQVHLIHGELLDELCAQGFDVVPGALGENVTTRGVDLLGLPTGAQLRLGDEAVVEVTGLRNPLASSTASSPGSWPPFSTATRKPTLSASLASWPSSWPAGTSGLVTRSLSICQPRQTHRCSRSDAGSWWPGA